MLKKIDFKNLDISVYTRKLKNGLDVFYIPYEHKNNYFMSFLTKYGSSVDDFVPSGKKEMIHVPQGVAHFLEHKMFEMEDGIDPFSFFSESGTGANANTWFTRTQYICWGNKDIEKNLEYLLEYVSKPYFTDENVKKEQGIIEQEIRMYDDQPEFKIDDVLRQGIFESEPTRNDIAGTVEEINKITKEILYECYYTFYKPSNMAVFISGKMDIDKLEAIMDQYDHTYKTKKENIKVMDYKEKDEVYKKEQRLKMNVVIPKMAYAIKINNTKFDCTQEFLEYYLNLFLTVKFGLTSKFREEAKKKKLMTSLYTEVFTMNNHTMISFYADSEKPDELKQEIKKEMTKDDITNEEISRIQKVWIASEVQITDSIEATLNNCIEDYLKYGNIVSNRVEKIKMLNKKDLGEIIKKIDFTNDSYAVIEPNGKQKEETK